jgi:serine/threonine protein kinase
MSPEQARGQAVGKRADIWAFGCVLYGMLTAKRAFDGDSIVDVLGAVARLEPDFDALPPEVPPRVRRVLQLCLRKDVRQRAQAMGDVRLALDGAFETEAPSAAVSANAAAPRAGLVLRAGQAQEDCPDRGPAQTLCEAPTPRGGTALPSGSSICHWRLA